eukprot:CAMPEP_0167779148 /NCGR_PEP_ID=MMETSP0111_2-20121227/4651_1 /TAXON_ID=91324 /ORGANISM="Lotharella globosa, Strain CCCM811" /LENGTH=245 /DNA_ID=CAMNT_0007669537 /DNA_START=36 /DNA_END=773 /DNA_ORIENTATION=-
MITRHARSNRIEQLCTMLVMSHSLREARSRATRRYRRDRRVACLHVLYHPFGLLVQELADVRRAHLVFDAHARVGDQLDSVELERAHPAASALIVNRLAPLRGFFGHHQRGEPWELHRGAEGIREREDLDIDSRLHDLEEGSETLLAQFKRLDEVWVALPCQERAIGEPQDEAPLLRPRDRGQDRGYRQQDLVPAMQLVEGPTHADLPRLADVEFRIEVTRLVEIAQRRALEDLEGPMPLSPPLG